MPFSSTRRRAHPRVIFDVTSTALPSCSDGKSGQQQCRKDTELEMLPAPVLQRLRKSACAMSYSQAQSRDVRHVLACGRRLQLPLDLGQPVFEVQDRSSKSGSRRRSRLLFGPGGAGALSGRGPFDGRRRPDRLGSLCPVVERSWKRLRPPSSTIQSCCTSRRPVGGRGRRAEACRRRS